MTGTLPVNSGACKPRAGVISTLSFAPSKLPGWILPLSPGAGRDETWGEGGFAGGEQCSAGLTPHPWGSRESEWESSRNYTAGRSPCGHSCGSGHGGWASFLPSVVFVAEEKGEDLACWEQWEDGQRLALAKECCLGKPVPLLWYSRAQASSVCKGAPCRSAQSAQLSSSCPS